MRIERLGLAVLLGFLIGCGGSEEPAKKPATPPTTAQQAAPTPPADADAYELDVIVEGEPDEGAPPLTVKFQGYVEEDDGGPWKFAWDFGDGATSTEQNPTHVYQKEGEYTAVVTVKDSKGVSGSEEVDILVEAEE